MTSKPRLAFCKDASDKLSDSMYKQLMKKAEAENYSLYRSALSRAKTKKQKEACAGYYCGNWQRLFNDWVNNKIENTHVLTYLNQDHLDYQSR